MSAEIHPIGLICDCCDRSTDYIAVYETDDDDAVLLCADCSVELREMVEGSEMEGTS